MLAANQIINKLIDTKDYNFIKTNGLEPTYFTGYEKEFQFIVDHYKQYGNIPDEMTFLEHFQNFERLEVAETNDYLLDKLYEEYGYTLFNNMLPTLNQFIKEDSRKAYEYLKSQMDVLKPHTVCRGIDIIQMAMERYQKYLERSQNQENATIKTGLLELDEILGGWEYGDELVTVVARTNQGKSWLLMKFLAEAWKQGKRVGLYSGEMNEIKLGFRFDTLFNHFSNKALVRGFQTDGYKEYIESLTAVKNPFIIITQKEFGGRPTVQKIRNFIEENNIEIMGIDQYSLMEDGRARKGDQPRTRLAHIAEDLFLLSSEYRIPILGLAQANRGAVDKDNQDAPGLENIKESDDISHNSSKCIGMRQTNYGLVLDIIKNREGRVGDKLLYSWDIDVGHMSYIPSGDDAARPETRQQSVTQNKQVFQPSASFNPF